MRITGKYGNRRVQLDGYTFDSQAEANRYVELKLLVRGGVISSLRVHPPYIIQSAFTHKYAGKVREIRYVADFEYVEKGVQVVEDVKGVRTPAYQLKRKLMLAHFAEMDFRELKV